MTISKKFILFSSVSALISGCLLLLVAQYGIRPILTQADKHVSMSVKYSPAPEFVTLNNGSDQSLTLFIVVLIAVSLLVFLLQMIYFRRIILVPLRNATEFSKRLANGDYKAELPAADSDDEIDELYRELGFVRDRMQNYLSRLEASRERENNVRRKVETSSAIKGDFLANMSLELKNPLTAISGFTNLLRQELTEWKFTESKLQKCDIILENAESINAFFDKLMMLSQMGAGSYPLCSQEIDVAEFLQQIIENVYHRLEKRNVTISCLYSPEQPQKIIADHDILHNAISMLLEGIVKTSQPGSAVRMGCKKDGPWVIFWIDAPRAESGHSSIASIFRKHFIQASGTRLSDISGITMLNLALAKSGFDLLHAKVSVNGPHPEGDSFSIAFNAEDVQEEVRSVSCPLLHYATNFNLILNQAKPAGVVGKNETPVRAMNVLMLETDVYTRMLVAEILYPQGHKLDVVHRRHDCLEMVGSQPYDLLIIDLQLPFNRYLDLVRQISSWSSCEKMHVMVFAPYLTDHEKEQFTLCGIDECIFKPFDMEQLVRRLREIAISR